MENITAANERINQLTVGANLCFQSGLWLPGLCLLFVAIDTFASLERPEGATRNTKTEFVAWVEEFLLPNSTIPCSGLDLYASRCGLLHRQSPSSQLFEDGRVKQVWYAWGSTTVEELRAAADKSKLAGQVIVVHIDQLRAAFRNSQHRFLETLEAHPERAALILERADGDVFMGVDDNAIRRLAGN